MQCGNCYGKKEMTNKGFGAWVCPICDLYPFITEPLEKGRRMNIAKTAGLELERRRKEHGKGMR